MCVRVREHREGQWVECIEGCVRGRVRAVATEAECLVMMGR